RDRVWDTVADVEMIGTFGRTFARLHEISKPTIAAVQGWCIAGGTDMVLNADLIVAGRSARFGYPPARVWGVPEAPWVWVARLGLERAKRYLFTGDEISAEEAAAMGMILEVVDDDQLDDHAADLARRVARLPLNQLKMMKWMLNDVARQQYQPDTSRLLGFIFDGVARHTQEGLDFVRRAQDIGWREAVRERDAPFGDYGERGRPPAPDV
ncbi:MAG TPA: enoyl-CoA hydratase-related protein, partial [Acidimicrobiales bacterium]|nr:enoyl-CoA hydratase-related protein [Acidimicrobiales bacterium]